MGICILGVGPPGCYHAHILRILGNVVYTLTPRLSDQIHCSVAEPSSSCKRVASASNNEQRAALGSKAPLSGAEWM